MTLESELPGAVALITPDNEALGRALARRSLEEYRGGTVLLLDCLPENTGVRARVEAAEAALIRGGATVLRWSETGEEELARLDEAGSLAQVVALEAGTTERAAEIKERSGSGAALYGVGVTGRIAAWLERGTISAVAAWSEYAAGYLAVQQAVGAASEKTEPLTGTLPFSVVGGDEIYEPEYQSCCSRSRPDRRRAAALSALLACALLLSGCESRGTEKTETVRVGVAIYQQDDTFISNVVQEMERLAREKEGEPLKINLSIADGQSNQTLQMEQVDRFLDWGCDVLCVNMVDRTAAAVIVDKAEEAGVPVIFFQPPAGGGGPPALGEGLLCGAKRRAVRDISGTDRVGAVAGGPGAGGPEQGRRAPVCDAGGGPATRTPCCARSTPSRPSPMPGFWWRSWPAIPQTGTGDRRRPRCPSGIRSLAARSRRSLPTTTIWPWGPSTCFWRREWPWRRCL